MRTLYVRNVPDEVVARLELLAGRARVSVNTYVLWELEATARRAGNAELLAALPDLGIPAGELVGEVPPGQR